MSSDAQAYKVRRSPSFLTGLHVPMIVLLGLACYCNSFSAPFMFDDFASIIKNPDITGGKNLWELLLHGGSRRIADISFALNYRLHGLHIAGYHITNLAIHLSSAVALYFLTVSLLDSLNLSDSPDEPEVSEYSQIKDRFIPLSTALIFVCHPLQTQAVTYIVQRHTSLATLFYLLALLAYLKGRITFEKNGVKTGVLFWGLLLSVMSLLAFHTKQITFTLPLMMVMLEVFLFRDRMFKRFIVVTGLVSVLLFMTLLLPAFLNGSFAGVMFDLRHATSEDIYFARYSYFITQIRVVVTYLRLLIMPFQQNLDYDYPIFTSIRNAEVLASLFLHFMLLAAAFVLYRCSRRHSISADLRQRHNLRLISFGIVWFYIALIIESSFIPITDVIMEHRVYLPSVGFCISFAALMHFIFRKLQRNLRYQWIALAAICLVLSTLTVARNRTWSDDLRFWQDAAGKSPAKGRVVSNLGIAHLKRGQYELALRLFVEAIKLDTRLENAWASLGLCLKGMNLYEGRFLTGEEFLTKDGTMDMRWYKQRNSSEFNNMGLSCEFVGRPDDAHKWYVQSVSMNPDFDLGWFNLGLLSARLGKYSQGEAALMKLKYLNPDLADKLAGYIRPHHSIP